MNRVARVVHRRDIHRGDLTPRALQNGDQLAPAVRGCCRDNQSILGDIKIGIDQPAQCRSAERIGIARGQFIRPVRRTEAAAEHIKGLIAYRIQQFGGDIVSEDEIKDLEDELQKITDKFVKDVDKAVEDKAQDILKV